MNKLNIIQRHQLLHVRWANCRDVASQTFRIFIRSWVVKDFQLLSELILNRRSCRDIADWETAALSSESKYPMICFRRRLVDRQCRRISSIIWVIFVPISVNKALSSLFPTSTCSHIRFLEERMEDRDTNFHIENIYFRCSQHRSFAILSTISLFILPSVCSVWNCVNW